MLERFKGLFSPTKEHVDEYGIQPDTVPYHVAIIMDGNGRWAKKRGLPRIAGHRAGMKTVKEVTIAADDIGVKVLTLYAFSTENWKRPLQEVDFLMRLPEEFLALELDELMEKNVQIRVIGDSSGLPAHTRKTVFDAVEKTKQNTGLILNIALNYGGRAEIIDAVRTIVQEVIDGKLSVEDVSAHTIEQHLLTSGLPDPDLLIRTSGEIRLSNFLLWQSAYTELWFTDVLWPDFRRHHFFTAIRDYQKRGRRFGGLN
ncbi:isoprenyl transferase [Collibacillus ludicampi]|uniref:Isoprenyl transferase n=1 Tax=Collibacillus ludicampi TaxID=2771369 RepID=A0AAV4LKD2_9BACL|nr:isoprenyl transferase [Collibacillus ludicampi]GIM47832.1 isoprenyl transferase [Collibacillus ludicampi]